MGTVIRRGDKEAIIDLKGKPHLQTSGWKYARVADEFWEDAVTSAERQHTEGKLFQKCQTNVVPEYPPAPAELDEPDVPLPAHEDPALEVDDDDHNDVILLGDEDVGQETHEEVVEMEAVASSSDVHADAAVAHAPEPHQDRDIAKFERLMALRLVYGRGP